MRTKFKFEIESEGLTQEQAQAFGAFVNSLQSKVTGLVTRGIDAEAIEKGVIEAPKPKRRRTVKAKEEVKTHREDPAPKQEEPKQEEPKQEEPKQEEPKQEEPKQEEPKQEEPTQEEPTQEEPTQEERAQEEPKQEAQASKYTVQDVRAKLTPLVKTNRDAIIEKLRSFDAKSVTALDPKHYDAMMVFLETLA